MYITSILDTPIKPVVGFGFPCLFRVAEDDEEEDENEEKDVEEEETC